jgi:hypothetical protein
VFKCGSGGGGRGWGDGEHVECSDMSVAKGIETDIFLLMDTVVIHGHIYNWTHSNLQANASNTYDHSFMQHITLYIKLIRTYNAHPSTS